jgi:DNA-binding HxlR family transcriptional regulator
VRVYTAGMNSVDADDGVTVETAHPRAGTAYDVTCPAREVLTLIASKWTILVVDALSEGTKRYSALYHEITGVSQKMLTQTLRDLERDGLVVRTVHDTKPPSVDYRLTELGRCLSEPITAVRAWADTHFTEIARARNTTAGDSRDQ